MFVHATGATPTADALRARFDNKLINAATSRRSTPTAKPAAEAEPGVFSTMGYPPNRGLAGSPGGDPRWAVTPMDGDP